ncbi:MAG: TolC family protein [Candidatus Palauibacterales bacterium]|nr:TolC family protein [Candidatus Palauibacterales bacterium]
MTRNTTAVAVACLVATVLLAAPGGAAAQEEVGPAGPVFSDTAARSVSLDEAIRIALRRNPGLEESRANLNLAQYDRLTATGSFLPRLNLGYGYSNASTGRLDPTGQTITRTSYTLQLGGSLTLFDGFRRFRQLRSSRLQVRAERAGYRESRYEVIRRVKQSYYDAVANRELVVVERDRVERQRDQLQFVREQVKAGRATRTDRLRSEVELNNARLALLNARNDARASRYRLAQALGSEGRVAPARDSTLTPDTLAYTRSDVMRMALRAGPSLEAAEAQVEAARAEVEATKSSYLPSLSLQGGYAWQNPEFPPENRSWSLSLQGSLPLFDGFEREAQMFRAEARMEMARAQRTAAELALRTEVDAAYSQVEAARAGMELARANVELARENLNVTRERYRLGLASILDLQSAQIDLEEAQVELIQRRFDHRMGVAQLEALVGRGLTVSSEGESQP